MKKFSYLFLALLFSILVGCSAEKQENKASEGSKSKDESVNVDKGLLNVKVTIPASMFEGEDTNKVIADAKKEGIEVSKNNDGSLTYKMSKSQHKKMMKEIKEEIVKTINEAKESKEYVSLKDITYNDSFSEFTLIVDRSAFENSFDGLLSITVGMSGMMYQLYNGENSDVYQVTIFLKDQATGKEFDKIVYPDALEEE